MTTSEFETPAGVLEAIWIKPAHRQPMVAVDQVDVVAQRGLVGNINQGSKRQITILGKEAWERSTSKLDAQIDPRMRRANLVVSGIDLEDSRGKTLSIGDLRIILHGETKPCRRMDEAYPGLQEALRGQWAGGAYGIVLDNGTLRVGDSVELS